MYSVNEFSTMISKRLEAQRRTLCISTDKEPSIHHKFNLAYSKKYIKGKDVLDIGCWTGQFETLIAPIAKSVTGIDPNKKAINYAKRQVKKVKFVVSNAEVLPFKKHSFDTVTIMDVIEHVPQGTESQVFSEIYRVLKPNGTLILSTPNRHIVSILLDPAYFLIGHRHYSVNKLKDMLLEKGFIVTNTRLVGNLWELVFHNIELLVKHLLKKSFTKPTWVMQAISQGYNKKGFAEVYLIAKKTQERK